MNGNRKLKFWNKLLIAGMGLSLIMSSPITARAESATTKVMASAEPEGGWYKSDFKVTLTADNFQPTGNTVWKVSKNKKTYFTVSSSYKITEEAKKQKLYFYAEDSKDATKKTKVTKITYSLDKTKPKVQYVNFDTSKNKVTITAKDSLSGIAKYGMGESNDSTKAKWQKSAKFKYTEGKKYYFFAKDKAGNIGVLSNVSAGKKDINKCKIKLAKSSFNYTGSRIEPEITVKSGSLVLTKNKDYTVSYVNNISVGTGKMFVKGKGSYFGQAVKTFKIKEVKWTAPSIKKTYKGKEGESITIVEQKNSGLKARISDTKICQYIKSSGKLLLKKKGTTLVEFYMNADKNHKAFSKTATITVKESSPSPVTDLTGELKNGKLYLNWKNPENYKYLNGYVIQVFKDSKFKTKLAEAKVGNTTKSKNFYKMDYEKVYVRIRSFKENDGDIKYSKYTKLTV